MGLYVAPGYVTPGYINDGSSPIMPNVIGVDWQQATAALIQAGVVPNNGTLPGSTYVNLGYFDVWPVDLNWVAGTGVRPGFVVNQSPSNGSAVDPNSTVLLTVANFPFGVADLYSAGGYS